MRNRAAVMVAFLATLGAGGAAFATNTVVNVTWTPDVIEMNGRYTVTGDVPFAPVTLWPGDTIDLNVSFDRTYPDVSGFIWPDPDPILIYDVDGFADVVWWSWGGSVGPTGFSDFASYAGRWPVSATVSNLSFFGTTVPEPATWALVLLGVGGVGAATRSSRRKAAKAIA